jgi:hypothetical protein
MPIHVQNPEIRHLTIGSSKGQPLQLSLKENLCFSEHKSVMVAHKFENTSLP